ncbi:hypothetical protein O4H53_04140 [Sulfitobacter sp. G21635-S1]|uniref:hypothetical protein n=1 Tax=Sulfitobacter sp. G21635-S1 TaxID=3014043 RepID=UPI0022AE98DA|nr:hypothetical protein [Sulfitobacter sp. G21635-S1]MCZ4254717.1 hypothetical protein [Sulfitobacter sp. G21635-S1]
MGVRFLRRKRFGVFENSGSDGWYIAQDDEVVLLRVLPGCVFFEENGSEFLKTPVQAHGKSLKMMGWRCCGCCRGTFSSKKTVRSF